MAAHASHHLLSKRAVVKSLRAVFSDQAHRVGERLIDDALTFLPGRAARVEIGRACSLLARKRLDGRKPRRKPRRHGKAVVRQGDGGREEFAPRPLAMFLVRQFEQRNCARDADRDAGRDGFAERQRLAIGAEEHGGRSAGWRRLAAVIDRDRLAGGVVMEQEPAAAQARGLRLDHAQRHLNCDRGVYGRAAIAQHREARLGRERMGGRHHLARFGLRRTGVEQRDSDEQAEPLHARRATMNSRRNGKSVMPSARVG